MFTLVVGTGYTGRRVLDLLPADSVMGLSRSAADTNRPVITLDLDSASMAPVDLPARYAVLYTVPPKGDPPDKRLRRFLSMLVPAAARLVYISTTGVYGDRGGQTVSEATPVKPSNARSARRVAAEALLAEWVGRNDCELIVLRAPGIYGPGRLGLERIQAGLPAICEDSARPGNRIHVDDLASCCIAALSPGAPAGIYNVGDNDHRSPTWFTGEVARQSGLPAPPEISLEQAKKEFSAQRLSFMTESRRVDTTKMRRVLGVIPRYSNPEHGIAASLAEEAATVAQERPLGR
ncbi:MAG: NAD-dependent epimerase/dehydratase family protein [Gammaproteobacteria bacterium]|nr:NAD-dependent epimerase/dehydratase family protein [Gammaproteobacteria bacterium]